MSSNLQKQVPKMCKSPKSASFQKIEYENLSTNCTVIGSNNLHLVKKPQIVTSMSPAYSNPSPGYPPSPYSSPASMKSPSPQSLKPPTPQPNIPVMQIIHNTHQLLARPVQTQQNVIKLKPHLNILPKPSASPQPSPKPSVSPQIVIPANQQTIVPTAQPLLLNQMPVLAPGVQLILRPQSKMQTQVQTPQGLILQQGGQQLLQLQSRSAQPMMRVLTNGMQLAQPTTIVTQVGEPVAISQANIHCGPNSGIIVTSPKKKPKKNKQKIDLANIMKLSGIGDEDDIQFESDTSQSESEHNLGRSQPPTPQPMHHHNDHANMLHSIDMNKRIGNIQISTMAQPTPLMQVLNQSFQSGVNTTSFQTSQAQAGIPFSPFLTPNITINNGLVVQRNGGFKLALGEDGRLVLQHDPTLNQDLQSQLLLQSIFGLNGLVLQPSVDQVHSQTVQTIQQQSVQTIQQQTVQSQTIQTVQQQTVQPQTVQHSLTLQPQIQTVQPQTVQQTVQQTIQHQTVQSQPITHTSQPMQIVQPQIQTVSQPTHSMVQSQGGLQSLHSIQSQLQGQIQSLIHSQSLIHPQPLQGIQHSQASQTIQQSQQTVHQHTVQSQPVLKVQPFQKSQPPVQTVHPQPIQTIHHHHNMENQQQHHPPTSYVVNLTPDQLEQLKRDGQLTVNGQTIFMQRPTVNKVPETQEIKNSKLSPKIKPVKKVNKIHAKHDSVKNNVDKNHAVKETKSSLVNALQSPLKHILPQAAPPVVKQPSAVVQPSIAPAKAPHENNQEADRLFGQMLEDPVVPTTSVQTPSQPSQRVHTIQLTPQQQQHLKSVQLQIQTLSQRLTPGDTEMHPALKLLFAEQQKILASGKLLPPDKVYYHNNQLTIVNPSVLGIPQVQVPKSEPPPLAQPSACVRTTASEIINSGPQAPPRIVPAPTEQLINHTVISSQVPTGRVQTPIQPVAPSQPQQQNKFIPSITKAQLLEQQLNMDQNGAVKPDLHTPFRDKGDACKRLIRYHCFNQPVLSQKDLGKADEIFELTAKHFIDKFSRMVDKYRFLLLKESMREVQTSELMMLDRMFLAEEQQSLMRLRQDDMPPPTEFLPPTPPKPPSPPNSQPGQSESTQEEYDEIACIQRELGCVTGGEGKAEAPTRFHQRPNQMKLSQHAPQPPKRSASSDSRLETLKKFRVDKHNKRSSDSVQNSSTSTLNSALSVQSRYVLNMPQQGRNSQSPRQSIGAPKAGDARQNLLAHRTYPMFPAGAYGGARGVPIAQQQFAHQSAFNAQMAQLAQGVHNVHSSNPQSQSSSHSDDNDSGNNSIDEQVQSAIDSILNLQQSSNLDLDEAVSSILS